MAIVVKWILYQRKFMAREGGAVGTGNFFFHQEMLVFAKIVEWYKSGTLRSCFSQLIVASLKWIVLSKVMF